MKAVIVAFVVLEEQGRGLRLARLMAKQLEKGRMPARIAGFDAQDFVPAVCDFGKRRVQGCPQLRDRLRQGIAKILVFTPAEAVARHYDPAAKLFLTGIAVRQLVALFFREYCFDKSTS